MISHGGDDKTVDHLPTLQKMSNQCSKSLAVQNNKQKAHVAKL